MYKVNLGERKKKSRINKSAFKTLSHLKRDIYAH